MTNWMTAAGIALIAGGLATLISFRAMLFGTGGKPRRGRGSRRRSSVAAFGGRPVKVVAPRDPRAGGEVARGHGERQGGLASIGFADEEEVAVDGVEAVADEPPAALHDEASGYDEPDGDELPAEAAEEEFDAGELSAELSIHPTPGPRVDRSDRRYGDRVEGWVRPEYRDLLVEPPSGDYWTPIPGDLEADPEPSARGYGWPVPVERLPAVPPYEPATGFDLKPIESEPTELVPVWTRAGEDRAGRIRLPRSWAARNEKPRDAARREDKPAAAEQRRRPRPRPRPDSPADRGAAVYVSRHAAEPPR